MVTIVRRLGRWLRVGVGVAGTLTANGNLSLGGGTFAVDLNGTTSLASDQLVVNGNLSLTAQTTLNATFLSSGSVGQVFPVITYTGAFGGSILNLIPASRSLAVSNTGERDRSDGDVGGGG